MRQRDAHRDVCVDMDHLLMFLLLLWSSGVQAEGKHNSTEPGEIRLVGTLSRCSGNLEVKHQGEWRAVGVHYWTMEAAAVVCEQLDCGSVVSVSQTKESTLRAVLRINSTCIQSRSALKDCGKLRYSYDTTHLTCSDFVRLLNGTRLCSGRLEVNTKQFNQLNQSEWQWSSVCEADFDQQDAEVVCRELGCGAPSVLQGVLYGDVAAPMWTKEFQCGGTESALLNCRRSGSARNSCSSGRAVGLTCSELGDDVQLVGGAGHCDGTLELKLLREWRPVYIFHWTLKTVAVFCHHLACGSPASVEQREVSTDRPVWYVNSDCVQSGSAVRDCATPEKSSFILNLTCTDAVRLVNGTGLCSGRLEVNTNLLNQSERQWSSVCEADFDLQDAEVVCRELGCGAPSVLQGVLYGDVVAPMWTREFQCGGTESALLDCRSSGSATNSCSSGRAVGLTCSEPIRLVGGTSRCAGTPEVKHHREWRLVYVSTWNLQVAAAFCERLDCGFAVSVERKYENVERLVWWIRTDCIQSGSDLRDCTTSRYSSTILTLTCSELQPPSSVL